MNNGELNLEIVCGAGIMSEYADSVISIIDSIVQHKDILKNNASQITKFLVPSLMENFDTSNSDFKVESIKVLSEISVLFFNKQDDIAKDELRSDLKFMIETKFFDVYGLIKALYFIYFLNAINSDIFSI